MSYRSELLLRMPRDWNGFARGRPSLAITVPVRPPNDDRVGL